jgi:hypothetical protein
MLKIHASGLSSASNKVLMAANALNLTFEKIFLDLR